jgi:uncharacterized membrane protein YdbT with pleckstrin-like domain
LLLAGYTGDVPHRSCKDSFLTVSRFSYVVMAADQIVTVAASIRFQYDDGRTFINWATGMDTSPALWISVFLVVVIMVNMIPVKVSLNAIRCGTVLIPYDSTLASSNT